MNQKHPTVTIILPTYNTGNILRAQVDSILAQTYPSLELLLVDDGSTDESPNIAQEYANHHPTIHFQLNEVHQGLQATINAAMKNVTGDLIALSDHDDVWIRDKIARQVTYFAAHPEVVCAFSDRVVIDLEDRVLCLSEYRRIGTPPEIVDTAFLLDSMARYTHANTLMFRRQLIDFVFPIPYGWDWWIAAVASWFGSVAFMRDRLVRYRVYEGSVSSNQRLYIRGNYSLTTRAHVQANIRNHFDNMSSLYIRAQQLIEYNPPMLLIKNWLRWYEMLLELLTHPAWKTYWNAVILSTKICRTRQLIKPTLYTVPLLHKTYLRLAAYIRGY